MEVQMEYMDRRTNIAGWLVLGSLAGAAAALLLAPASGKATREKLARGVRDGADKVRELSDRLMAEADELGSKVRRRVDDGEAYFAAVADTDFSNDGLGRGLDRATKEYQRG
jgi:gas vesicle protein